MDLGLQTEPLTPDFARHRWHGLSSATLTDHWVAVSWPDGLELDCYSLWLAENVVGVGLDPATRESTIDPASLPAPAALISASVEDGGGLRLVWDLPPGRVECSVHPGWLRHVAEQRHLPSAGLPDIEVWSSETFSVPPTLDGSTILDDEIQLAAWLRLLVRYGIGRLVDTPTSEDFIGELCRRIGPIRGSNFGEIFSVQAVVAPDSTANTGLGLGQHTDLPTRETPPGFQFLHCVANDVPGGFSRMTDGHAVVEALRSDHAEEYEALTTLEWVFMNRSPVADHRWVGPLIDHADDGFPLTLRAFYPVRGFPHMDACDVPRAYAAMRTFSTLAHDPRFQIRYPFEPGDLVGFDNRRVLHGRDVFDPGGGSRHLRGCYLDQDDVRSTLRVLTRTV